MERKKSKHSTHTERQRSGGGPAMQNESYVWPEVGKSTYLGTDLK